MGGIDPVSVAVTVGLQAIQQAQQQKQAKAAAQAQAQQQAMGSQLLWQQQKQRVDQQRDLLKRQQASARAAFAAGGVGLGGGSGQALLDGLTRQTEANIAADNEAASLKHGLQFGERGGVSRVDKNLALAEQSLRLLRPLVT